MAAIDFDNLIDINLLSYYDTRIKAYILEQINNSNEVVFIAKDKLPTKGEINVLYVTEEGLYLWDTEKYTQISNGQGGESNVIFLNNTDELPVKGQIKTLYIAGKTFYMWDGTQYINLSITSGGGEEASNPQWGSF